MFIVDGVTDESRQGWHGNVQVQNLDRFWQFPAVFTPLILANKDLQGGHIVIQIVNRHGKSPENPPVFIADGMTDESWQEWHSNV